MVMDWLRNIGVYAVAALALCLTAYPGFAQSNPVACIAAINKEFGSNVALNANCPSKTDCSFLAKPGNTQAQTVITSIVQKAENCFKAAGQKLLDEQAQEGSIMRQFDGNDESRCAILVSKPGGDTPQGVRVICQKK